MTFIHETAIIFPGVIIEPDVQIAAYCVIGGHAEHRDHWDKPGLGVLIKSGARLFEHVTVHTGTVNQTVIGKNTVIMQKNHIAHDCIIGDNVLIGGQTSLAGHTIIQDGANISGKSCSFQKIVIGAYSFIGGFTFLVKDVPPGTKWIGYPAHSMGFNEVGLDRAGMTFEQCIERYQPEYERLIKERDQ